MALARLPGALNQIAHPIRLLDGTLPLAAMPLPGPLGLDATTGLGTPGDGRPGGLARGEAVALVDIRIQSGATNIPPGPDAPKGVKFAAKPAAVTGTGVAVEAVFSPDVSGRSAEAPPDVTW